jgi:hypothetical protein
MAAVEERQHAGAMEQDSEPTEAEKAQMELRKRIMKIMMDPNLTDAEKSQRRQDLMSGKWSEDQDEKPGEQLADPGHSTTPLPLAASSIILPQVTINSTCLSQAWHYENSAAHASSFLRNCCAARSCWGQEGSSQEEGSRRKGCRQEVGHFGGHAEVRHLLQPV